MPRFKVGDRVQHIGWEIGISSFGRLSNRRAFAVIVETRNSGMSYRIQYEDPAIEASWSSACELTGMWWDDRWLLPAPKPLDVTKPVQQRCGRPAEIVGEDGPLIKAKVYLPSGPRVLSYAPSGFFYKSISSDHDLVNA